MRHTVNRLYALYERAKQIIKYLPESHFVGFSTFPPKTTDVRQLLHIDNRDFAMVPASRTPNCCWLLARPTLLQTILVTRCIHNVRSIATDCASRTLARS